MDTPVRNDALTPKDLRYYAPRKVRTGVDDQSPIQSAPIVEEQRTQPPRDSTSDQIAPLPHIFQPQVPESQKKNRTGGFVKILALIGAAAAAGLFIGINLLDAIQGRDEAPTKTPEMPLAARLQSATTDLQKVSQPILPPQLTASDVSGDMNAALPLGLDIKNYTPGAMVELSGLPPGTALTTGTATGNGQWRIAVDDVSKTRITPPAGYVGPMTPTAQVATGNGQIVVHAPLRLSWRAPPPAPDKLVGLRSPGAAESPSARNAEASPPPAKTETPVEPKKSEPPAPPAKADAGITPRKIEASASAALLRRAEELIANGDLAAARLLLQRVAETKNAQAAFELASTYDPAVIKKFANNSIAADPALAQFWYERARDWGSPDAASPLEALASRATAK